MLTHGVDKAAFTAETSSTFLHPKHNDEKAIQGITFGVNLLVKFTPLLMTNKKNDFFAQLYVFFGNSYYTATDHAAVFDSSSDRGC